MKKTLICLCLLWHAAIMALPLGCFNKDNRLKEGRLELTPTTPGLFLIKNIHDYPIFLHHMTPGGPSSRWLVEVAPGHYAAFKATSNPFDFVCFEKKPGMEIRTTCQGLVETCRQKEVKLSVIKEPDAWVEVDQEFKVLQDNLERL